MFSGDYPSLVHTVFALLAGFEKDILITLMDIQITSTAKQSVKKKKTVYTRVQVRPGVLLTFHRKVEGKKVRTSSKRHAVNDKTAKTIQYFSHLSLSRTLNI